MLTEEQKEHIRNKFDSTHYWDYERNDLFKAAEEFAFVLAQTDRRKSNYQRLYRVALWFKRFITPFLKPVEYKPVDPIPVPKPEPPKIFETIQEMVLRVCKEEGLNQAMTDRLYKTVEMESRFIPNAENLNKDGTRDCGIAQLNEKWYLIPNKMSCQDAKINPERCIKIMAKAFKNGRAKDWIAYRKLYGA